MTTLPETKAPRSLQEQVVSRFVELLEEHPDISKTTVAILRSALAGSSAPDRQSIRVLISAGLKGRHASAA